MTNLPVISSLWIGSPLSFLEQVCIKSFLDAGHRFKLYSYEKIANVPAGCEECDATDILVDDDVYVDRKSGSPAPFADKFRLHMLHKTNEIWADADAYCVKPFPDQPYIFAPDNKGYLYNSVMRLPAQSALLKSYMEFVASPNPVLPDDWTHRTPRDGRIYRRHLRHKGEHLHISELPWGTFGPRALTYFARKLNVYDERMEKDCLYPFGTGKIKRNLERPDRFKLTVPASSISVHFFGSFVHTFLPGPKFNGLPPYGSLLEQLCVKHEIDPTQAPMLKFAKPEGPQ